VGCAENAGRAITVDDLPALAVVFETTRGYFLAPTSDIFVNESPQVEVGDRSLPGVWLVAMAAAGDATPQSPTGEGPLSAWARFFEVLAQLVRRGGVAGRDARLLHQTLARLRAATAQEEGPRR
jgi:hypothetical protein